MQKLLIYITYITTHQVQDFLQDILLQHLVSDHKNVFPMTSVDSQSEVVQFQHSRDNQEL